VVEQMRAIGGNRPGMAPVIPHKDPPAHGRQRRIVIKAVTSKFLKWEEFIEAQAAKLLDEFEGRDEIDLIEAVAAPLPIAVIADILGMPKQYLPKVKGWSDDMARTAGRFPSDEDWMTMARSISEQRQMFADEVRKRLDAPQPDLIGRIAAMTQEEADAETGDEPLDFDEGVELLTLVMLGGNETTTQLMGGALYYLATQPGLLDRIREDEKLIAGVIEEALRLTTPVFTMMRFAKKDGEIGGVPIPKGSVVSVCWNQANRDPKVFDHPDEFDPQRDNARRHLAFGQGIHVCPGAQLARLETRILLKRFAERVKSLELAGPDAVEYDMASLSVRGMTGLRVRYQLFDKDEIRQVGEAA
jgi:cytochrome P450